MSKNWYPVIDYEKCSECGACFDKCCQGVYELRGNTPVVVNPDGCIEGCRGCQKLCPSSAIEYVGDTGTSSECSCECCDC